ncbi:TBCEL [Bugula neritina]|uniref:TBCEL n=1 Tax=Bugula neritina TaxID=10212 RepID=A0A7J7IZA5_BUGNE|nr:TBCEL [Bugula neritina]
MQLLSVHFPHLHLVNGTSLASQELKNAETVYLRHFEHLELKPLRYSELLAKHGPLQELADISLEPPFSVALTVEHGDSSQVIDVPTKQKISDLKKTLAQIVGFKNFRLFYEHKGCTRSRYSHILGVVWSILFV